MSSHAAISCARLAAGFALATVLVCALLGGTAPTAIAKNAGSSAFASAQGGVSVTAVAAGELTPARSFLTVPSSVGGFGKAGALGDGSSADSRTPVTVEGIANAIQISAGGDTYSGAGHTCALISGGTIKCWDEDDAGDLGDGSTEDSSSPVSVVGITNATQMAVGDRHACAVLSDKTVDYLPGLDSGGQLGNGSTADSSTPVKSRGT